MKRGFLQHEKDIEELRRVALVQHTQINQLIAALRRKCQKLELLTGSKDELQQTLAQIETLTAQVSTDAPSAAPTRDTPPKLRKERATFGPTPQPRLPMVAR